MSHVVSEPTSVTKRVLPVELFFDLVYVFAITQVTTLVLDDLDVEGVARAALVLAMVWWAWSQYAWTTNAVDLGRTGPRLAVVATMVPTLLLAIAIPEAFGTGGAWFAWSYVVVRLLGLTLYWFGLRDEPDHQAALRTFVPLAAVAPLLVAVGGLVDDPARTWLWVVALAVDVGGALSAGRGAFRVHIGHFAERYGLIVIVALGESVVATGLGAEGVARSPGLALTVAVAVAGAITLWWSYFDWVADAAERRLQGAAPDRRARLARDLYTFLHFPIVAGVVLYAAAAKKTVSHGADPLSAGGRLALAAGIGLFLSGFVAGNWVTTRTLLRERLTAIVAVGLLTWLGADLDATVLVGTATAVVAAALAVEKRRHPPARAA